MFENISVYIYLFIVFLFSVSFHEFSHAYISYKLGDPTAKNQGRLTMNPLKHLDILGTIMIFVARIGWAKPVPINPTYYKDRKKGTMLVSVAGPLSNIVLSFVFAFPYIIMSNKIYFNQLEVSFMVEILYNLSYLFFVININLAIFNIIPVPPLDGSKILSGILPSRYYFKMMQYENYISIGFLIVIFVFSSQFGRALMFVATPIQRGILLIVKPIVDIFFNIH